MDEIRILARSRPPSPGDQLDLRPPRLQARRHGERRSGHAAFRMPLRRLRERLGEVGHGRRPGRLADRGRWLITNFVGGDRGGPLSRVRARAEKRRGAAPPSGVGDEPGRLPARPGRRPLASPGPHETAHRLRGHGGPPRRGRCSGSASSRNRTTGWRARAAPATSRRLRQAPKRHRAVRLLLPENLPRTTISSWFWPGAAPIPVKGTPAGRPGGRERRGGIAPATPPDRPGIRASSRGREHPRRDP